MKYQLLAIAALVYSCQSVAQTRPGCTDSLAQNYDVLANKNNGSCIYASANITMTTLGMMDTVLMETSGLTIWNQQLWTHVDDSNTKIYAIEASNGSLTDSINLTGTRNMDWEAMATDDEFLYMGDFGNNVAGNRQDLKIYKIKLSTLLNGPLEIDSIVFNYEDQTSFTASASNATDFDAEAMAVTKDSILIFTKNWVSNTCKVYHLTKHSGLATAVLKDTLAVNGLITDAYMNDSLKITTLIGYSPTLQPFVYLMYDYEHYNFSTGNRRKINLSPGIAQAEAITSADGLQYWVTSEQFSRAGFVFESQLFSLDLSAYLTHYLKESPTAIIPTTHKKYSLYPNPSTEYVRLDGKDLNNKKISIYNVSGQMVMEQITLPTQSSPVSIKIDQLTEGVYFLQMEESVLKFRKQ